MSIIILKHSENIKVINFKDTYEMISIISS
jgi:hypothetical protein